MQPTPTFWLGRQPILDLSGRTIGYELLFRPSAQGGAITDDRHATANVISHAFSELGLGAVLGDCRGFINFDESLLMSDAVELLPPERTVIELLESVRITPEVIARCRELRSRGFAFALDDIVQIDAANAAILPLVEFAKIDVLHSSPDALAELSRKARSTAPVKLLAEKVETREQADVCRKLGFELFQGYFFARPALLQGRRTDPSKKVLLDLLRETMSDADTARIEAIFKKAPELSYKLMRLVNSVGLGLRSPIQSLSHALVILGRRQLQRWIQVLLFAQQGSDDFPSALLELATARGKLMELIAQGSSDPTFSDRAFIAGILSLLDTLLELPMDEVVGQLNLPGDVSEALLQRGGALGHMLDVVEALERTDERRIASLMTKEEPCPPAELPQKQIEALSWSHSVGDSARGL